MRTLLPSHEWPDGHAEHASRVTAEAPVVNEPRAQVKHASAWPVCEYLLSVSQFVHFQAPAAEKVPFAQRDVALVPSQKDPAGHVVQVSRVAAEPPVVKEPFKQVLHTPAPWAANVLSLPQGVFTWPSHLCPAGHTMHAARSRKKALLQDVHFAEPSLGQFVPVAPVPFGQTHCLSAPHTASAVLLAAVAMTLPCASQSTTCWSQAPYPLLPENVPCGQSTHDEACVWLLVSV